MAEFEIHRRDVTVLFFLMRTLGFLQIFCLSAFAGRAVMGLAAQSLSPTLNLEEALELETKVVQAFNRYGCQKQEELSPFDQFPRLTALTIAISAYCAPKEIAEDLFARALALNPNHPLIALLRENYQPEVAEGDKRILPLPKGVAGLAATEIQLGYSSNPADRPGDDPKLPSSPLGRFKVSGAALSRRNSLAFGVNAQAAQTLFPSDMAANLSEFATEIPFLVEVGRREHVKLLAYSTYLQIHRPFYLSGGISFATILYRDYSRHTAQTALYWDNYFVTRYRAQAGTHFRFDYEWDYFPGPWYAKALFVLEHVQAGRETSYFANAAIPYSHNDASLTGTVEYAFGRLNLNVYTKFLVRYDDNSSVFRVGGITSPQIRRQRVDFQFTLQPTLIYPLQKGMHVLAYYRFRENFSNVGPDSYEDKNFEAHEAGLGFRLSWGEL